MNKNSVNRRKRVKKNQGSIRAITPHQSKQRRRRPKPSSLTNSSNSGISPRESRDKECAPKHPEKLSTPTKNDGKPEKEPDSESDKDAELEMKKSHVVLPTKKGKPQKTSIKHREVDEKDTERLLAKLKENKSQSTRHTVTLDEKSKIFMDRVDKKPYPAKYAKKNKCFLVADDDSEYFKKTKPPNTIQKKSSVTIIPEEDSYEYVPKLADVMKLPEENLLKDGVGPFWTMTLEPNEEESKDIEPPISVGSEHVEGFHEKRIVLKPAKSTKLVFDEFQPSCLLIKRDEKFFDPTMVFSNTVRSTIHVQGAYFEKSSISVTKSQLNNDPMEVEATQPAWLNVIFANRPDRRYGYERSRPILSAREEKCRLNPVSSDTKLEPVKNKK